MGRQPAGARALRAGPRHRLRPWTTSSSTATTASRTSSRSRCSPTGVAPRRRSAAVVSSRGVAADFCTAAPADACAPAPAAAALRSPPPPPQRPPRRRRPSSSLCTWGASRTTNRSMCSRRLRLRAHRRRDGGRAALYLVGTGELLPLVREYEEAHPGGVHTPGTPHHQVACCARQTCLRCAQRDVTPARPPFSPAHPSPPLPLPPSSPLPPTGTAARSSRRSAAASPSSPCAVQPPRLPRHQRPPRVRRTRARHPDCAPRERRDPPRPFAAAASPASHDPNAKMLAAIVAARDATLGAAGAPPAAAHVASLLVGLALGRCRVGPPGRGGGGDDDGGGVRARRLALRCSRRNRKHAELRRPAPAEARLASPAASPKLLSRRSPRRAQQHEGGPIEGGP